MQVGKYSSVTSKKEQLKKAAQERNLTVSAPPFLLEQTTYLLLFLIFFAALIKQKACNRYACEENQVEEDWTGESAFCSRRLIRLPAVRVKRRENHE